MTLRSISFSRRRLSECLLDPADRREREFELDVAQDGTPALELLPE